MSTKHTPGPWFFDKKGRVWRRNPSDLYENGGSVAGDQPIAFANIGWTGEGNQSYPIESNARLIAAAPDLLEALKFVMSAHGEQLDLAFQQAQEAIAKAEGGDQ